MYLLHTDVPIAKDKIVQLHPMKVLVDSKSFVSFLLDHFIKNEGVFALSEVTLTEYNNF